MNLLLEAFRADGYLDRGYWTVVCAYGATSAGQENSPAAATYMLTTGMLTMHWD